MPTHAFARIVQQASPAATVVFWYEIRKFLYLFFFVLKHSNKPKIMYEQVKIFVFHRKSSKNQNLTL